MAPSSKSKTAHDQQNQGLHKQPSQQGKGTHWFSMICQNFKLSKDHDKQQSNLSFSMGKIKNDLKERVNWFA